MNNVLIRPGGMSDSSDDEYDDEGFTFGYEESQKNQSRKTSNYEYNNNNNNNNIDDDKMLQNNYNLNMREKKQELEFEVITACMNGNLEVINQFIEAGNDVDGFLHTGWTLLLYAASAVKPTVIMNLLDLGADPNVHKDGMTPLMAVCNSRVGDTEQCLKCISMLIEIGEADPNATNKDRITALMFACEYRKSEVVSKLLEYVTNIEARDCDGRTAVFYAVVGNNIENLKILMMKNASISISDRRDLTVQDIASTKGYDNILELLGNEEGDIENYCPTSKVMCWMDAFPSIKKPDLNSIDEGIASILNGQGLEQYRSIFQGMELNKFLSLTENDLIQLGMDIQFHRKEFLDGLLKFHKKKWTNKSIGVVSKSLPYTIYNGVASLGNIARQLGAIGASFKFMRGNLSSLDKKEIILSDIQKNNYIKELTATEESLVSIKKDLHQMLQFAKKVEMTSTVHPPATYIDEGKKKINWPIFVGVAVMIGFYLSKTNFVKQFWN